MSKAQKAIDFAVAIAKDDSHGYDQKTRFGSDYDCSGLVISAWENAGVEVKKAGASYTGNMKQAFLKCGFVDVAPQVNLVTGEGLQAGDVLLHEGKHTALYIGNKQLVHASINELGRVVGGKPGDQTGREICVRSYYNHPWGSVLRYSLPEPMDFEQALDFISKKSGISKEYWANRKLIDPNFAGLMIKIATAWQKG